MQIPTVPSFVNGDYSLVKMQQLAQSVAFLTNAQRYPMWHVFAYIYGTGIGISANTWTDFGFNYCAFDSDQVFDTRVGNIITIRTQGYYAVEACLPFVDQASSYPVQAAFHVTAGKYNPHYSSGTSIQFGLKSGWVIAEPGNLNETICIEDLCPIVCYPGDTIAAQVWSSVGFQIDIGGPSSSLKGRDTCNFTGRWVRTGS